MHLREKQKKMLDGEKGEAVKKSMEILVGLGEIYGAEKLIPIQSAHVSGVSIRTSGEAGLKFIEEMAEKGAKTAVPTTINPAGMDLKDWRGLGAPEDMAKKQIRMVEAYKKVGAEPTCSCTPYLLDNKPSYGDHIAWSESSAVVYSNSVIGARTNREGAPSALASAITGLTPLYGYHLKENRVGNITIKPDKELFEGGETFPYSTLGYWIGENFPDSVPVIEGLNPTLDQQKALGAGLATSGAIALYHIPDVTPEAKKRPEVCETEESAAFGHGEMEETVDELDQTSDPDLICIGCPHASPEEVKKLSKISSDRDVWVCTARDQKNKPEISEILSEMENSNVRVVCDTCMVVAPLSEMGYSSIGVNSAKAAHYAPNLAGVKVHFAPLKELIK